MAATTEKRSEMPPTIPPWTQAMKRVLADGEWHPMDQVIRAGAKHVPPNKAQQWYRTGLGRTQTGELPQRVKAQDRHDQVRDGRWDGLRRILAAMARKGHIEIEAPEGARLVGQKRVRLKAPR